MHSIATMAELLRRNPGPRGLITANGGYLTKHSFGVYSATPPAAAFRWEDVQAEVDREPTRTATGGVGGRRARWSPGRRRSTVTATRRRHS